jgi:tRNA-Thr(GGU) m(6)t(6)A37 methyltransferase TsaA
LEKIKFKAIGIIRSPFETCQGTPIQPSAANGVEGFVDLYPEYAEALHDLEGFSHILLIYYFHVAKKHSLKVKPFLDNQTRGLFATRAPSRPNPIGISVVKLNKIVDTRLHIQNLDIIDGTPVLDIKPYVPEFDKPEQIKTGWLEKNLGKLHDARDDNRFLKK